MDMSEINSSCITLGVIVAIVTSCLPVQSVYVAVNGKMVTKMEETGASCITEHEGFGAVCLNRWVLQTAYYQYRQQYGNHLEETVIHK